MRAVEPWQSRSRRSGLIFEGDAGGRAPRIKRYIGTNRDISGKREPLRIGGKEKLLAVDEHTPIGSEHPIGASLEHQREILIDAEIRKNPVADIAKIKHITDANAGIRLKGTELGSVVLKEKDGRSGARTA